MEKRRWQKREERSKKKEYTHTGGKNTYCKHLLHSHYYLYYQKKHKSKIKQQGDQKSQILTSETIVSTIQYVQQRAVCYDVMVDLSFAVHTILQCDLIQYDIVSLLKRNILARHLAFQVVPLNQRSTKHELKISMLGVYLYIHVVLFLLQFSH